jgi:predicted dehydrogenase
LPGGVFGEYAPHPVYIVTALLGSISRVKAIARKFSEFSWVTADHLNVLFEAENGVGALTMSFNSPRYSFKTRIFGTEGLLDIDNCALTMTISKYRGYGAHALALEKLNLSYQMVKGAVSSSLKAATGRRYYKASHQSLMRQFISSIRNDLEPPVTGEDGRETIRVLEEIWKHLDSP